MINVNLLKLLHRKALEQCTNTPANVGAGGFVVSDKTDTVGDQNFAYLVNGVSNVYYYNADEDAWQQIANSGIAGTFAAGSCGELRGLSAPAGNITNTATGGTTTTVNTNLTLTRNLAGTDFRCVGGVNSGYIGKIKSNTIGANSVITLEVAASSAFTATSQYQMYGGSLWFFNAGTTAVGFAVYDRATNVWTQRSVTGLPTAWGTDGQLVSCPSARSNGGLGFLNGTATAGAASTLTTNKTLLLNQFANHQVRIVAGTGNGQIRKVSSNTAGANSVLTVSAAWTTNPDATSVYRVEGDDDAMFLFGSNSVTLYKYTISTNTWVTVSPTAARGGAAAAGGSADWIGNMSDPAWNDNTFGAHYLSSVVKQSGRYVYCLRGGGSALLDIYDLALNTWISAVPYGNSTETFNTGSHGTVIDGMIYLHKEGTSRIFRFDVAKHVLEPFTTLTIPQGTTVAGDKMFVQSLTQGATTLRWLYFLTHSRSELYRMLIV